MADEQFSVGAPYVRQIKDTSFEKGPSGAHDQETELPGHLELVVDVNGAPWVIARRKAPGLLTDIERAQKAGYTPPTEPTRERTATWADVTALSDRVAALEVERQPETQAAAPPPAEPPQG